MLTSEENAFVEYWSNNRMRQKKVYRQFLLGIPIGLLFAIPILLNFFSGWYKRARMVANSGEFDPGVLLIALLVIVAFIAIFSKRFQWDMNEQRYLELLAKKNKTDPENK